MTRLLYLLVLTANVLVIHCQEDSLAQEDSHRSFRSKTEGPQYSFGYGVTDAKTGDVKKVWESKNGDTVKGHYSVLEPDGSMRTVEYSANAKTGFQATVKNEGVNTAIPPPAKLEEKSLRDYGKVEYDFSAFPALDEKKILKSKYSYDDSSEHPSVLSYKDYLKRLTDDDNEQHRHKINSFSSKIKHGNKKGSYKYKNKYSDLVEIDLTKSRFPDIRDATPEMPHEYNSEKYHNEHSNIDLNKFISPFASSPHFKIPKLYETGLKHDKYKGQGEPYSDLYEYMSASELSNSYPDMEFLKSKKKPSSYKKNKNPELFHYSATNFDDDFVLVPKKKFKIHSKIVDPPSFDDSEEEYSHTHDENCRHKDKNKEVVVRKVIKKAKPVINLLDIFDI